MIEIATYDDKVKHVQVVAERGAQARKLSEEAGQRSSRWQAHKVFRAMATTKHRAGSTYASDTYLVFSDTPKDRDTGVSKAWAKHVRNVFVASFVAGEPKPKLPTR